MKKMSILFMLLISIIFVGCGSSGSDNDHDYKLISLEVVGGTLSKEFNPDVKNYTIYVDIQSDTVSLKGKLLNENYSVDGLFEDKNIFEFFAENANGINHTVTHTVYIDNNVDDNISAYSFEFKLKYEDYKIEVIKVKSGTTSEENGNLTVENDYYIGKYEVTQQLWYNVMKNNKNGVSAEPSQNVYDLSENYPVDSVTWYETLVFLNRLSILEGYNPVYEINGEFNPDKWGDIPKSRNIEWDEVVVNGNRDGYRLLTDIEWEYAARGGKDGLTTKSAGSDNIDEVAWHSGNSGNTTHPVGEKLPNELGIYDMCGNVWELTFDWYSSVYRSDRGGGYNYSSGYCIFPGKGWQPPYDTVNCLGFRLARDVK